MKSDQIHETMDKNSAVPNSSPCPKQDCRDGNKKFDERFHLVLQGTDHSLPFVRYRIRAATGEVFEGVTDAEGYTERVRTEGPVQLTVEVLEHTIQEIIGDVE